MSQRSPSRNLRVVLCLTCAALLSLVGCGVSLTKRPVHNFGQDGPIFRDTLAVFDTGGLDDELQVTSYNIAFGARIGEAIDDLRPLAGSDVLLLQEIDYFGVVDIARTLRMNYVYAPASIHPKSANGWFGNAILSPWPISLPELHELPVREISGQRRLPISALVTVLTASGPAEILVCSVHTATVTIGLLGQHRQWRAVREAVDRRRCELGVDRVIVGGDFNSGVPGSGLYARVFSPCFDDVTAEIERTTDTFLPCCINKLDHIFVRGLAAGDAPSIGSHGGSDHYPISCALRLSTAAPCEAAPCAGGAGS